MADLLRGFAAFEWRVVPSQWLSSQLRTPLSCRERTAFPVVYVRLPDQVRSQTATCPRCGRATRRSAELVNEDGIVMHTIAHCPQCTGAHRIRSAA